MNTNRHAFVATAAAMAALPASVQSKPFADAPLIDLRDALDAAYRNVITALEHCADTTDAEFDARAAAPVAACRQDDDVFNIGLEYKKAGYPYSCSDIELLRTREPTMLIEREVTPEDGLPACARTVVRKGPASDAQRARIAEIIAAYEASGLPTAEALNEEAGIRYRAAQAAYAEIIDQIVATPARTIEGLHIKALALATTFDRTLCKMVADPALECQDDETAARIGASMARDLAMMVTTA